MSVVVQCVDQKGPNMRGRTYAETRTQWLTTSAASSRRLWSR